jgi:AcrR family transcriptional regulator
MTRAEHKDVVQARIVQAAVELFVARGYDGTSISAIAARAHVSRGAVFWHFENKASLFRDTCKRFFVPFWREMEKSVEALAPRERLLALFELYEQFTSVNLETIEALVRWVLESPTMRESLRAELLALHAIFVADVRQALVELSGDPREAEILTQALISLLAGNLLFGIVDPGTTQDKGRHESLRAIVDRLLPPGARA